LTRRCIKIEATGARIQRGGGDGDAGFRRRLSPAFRRRLSPAFRGEPTRLSEIRHGVLLQFRSKRGRPVRGNVREPVRATAVA
jgi:hypothetical protein